MGKILTVSVAAYNVENSIRRALDSLIDEDIIDDLEIFVIDDGGTDQTLEIAREYAEKYPNSIFPVHKENEGYGSTVNYSIDHASGKYFKLLDGDDWFDQSNLKDYVCLLKQIDTDIMVTPYFKYSREVLLEKVDIDDKYTKDSDLSLSSLKASQVFGMWSLTFKTEVLRECNLSLPLHCLYTDQIYSTVPFAYSKNIRFANCSVYCYSIGEEKQSTSKKLRLAHIEDNLKVTDYLCEFYESSKSSDFGSSGYLLRRVSTYSKNLIKTFLLEPMSQHVMDQIKRYDTKLKILSHDVYRDIANIRIFKKTALLLNILRMVNYSRIGTYICKLMLPEKGIDNWA